MKYTCYKGWHWFLPFIPRFYWNRRIFEWNLVLDDNCRYDAGKNQSDWNKVIGISNHFNPRRNSLRAVMKWDPEKSEFKIGAYVEMNGAFNKTQWEIITTQPGKRVNIVFICNRDHTIVYVNGHYRIVPFVLKASLVIGLNPYIGGDFTAPHKMTLHLKPVR